MIAVLRAYRLLLRNGPLARLLAGEFVSSIGDWLYLVAILILVYEVSNDPLVLGIVGAARVLPYVILSIPAGILADRYDRRLILLVTDVARETLMLVMAALVTAHAPIVTIVVLAVVATCFSTFFSPAIGAYLPSLVADEEQLGPANSAWSTLGLLDARRRMGPGDGYADDEDDVIGHGMPEIPGAGDGFAAAPRLPRRDGLAGNTEDDVEGHSSAKD